MAANQRIVSKLLDQLTHVFFAKRSESSRKALDLHLHIPTDEGLIIPDRLT